MVDVIFDLACFVLIRQYSYNRHDHGNIEIREIADNTSICFNGNYRLLAFQLCSYICQTLSSLYRHFSRAIVNFTTNYTPHCKKEVISGKNHLNHLNLFDW